MNFRLCLPLPSWRLIAATAAGLAMLGLAAPPAVAAIGATSFTVYRGGNLVTWARGQNIWLHDGFDNGLPLLGPNVGGGSQPAQYLAFGLPSAPPNATLSESGGLLWLDPTDAAVGPNAAGQPGHSLRMMLSTDTQDATRGLSQAVSFGIALELSASHLPALGQAAGLRLADNFSNGNDVIDLSVVRGAGGLSVLLRRQDFAAHSVTTLAEAPLSIPAGTDTVVLGFIHDQAGAASVQASWAYLDTANHFVGGGPVFSDPIAVFNGEALTTVSLRATTLGSSWVVMRIAMSTPASTRFTWRSLKSMSRLTSGQVVTKSATSGAR